MILDLGLSVLDTLLVFLLSPLQLITISVDFLSSFDFVSEFFTVVAWLIPWGNILPLIILVFTVTGFKIGISLLKTLWAILPIP